MPYIPEQIHFCSVDEKKNRVDFYKLNAKLNHNCMLGYLIFVLISLALANVFSGHLRESWGDKIVSKLL